MSITAKKILINRLTNTWKANRMDMLLIYLCCQQIIFFLSLTPENEAQPGFYEMHDQQFWNAGLCSVCAWSVHYFFSISFHISIYKRMIDTEIQAWSVRMQTINVNKHIKSHTHTHTHTHSLSLSHTHTLSLSLTHTHTHKWKTPQNAMVLKRSI